MSRPLPGLLLALLAFALYSAMDTAVKWLSGGYALAQIVFFMSVFALVPLSVLVARSGGLRALATRRLHLHLMRGAMATGASFFGFYAYSRMPVADAYTLLFTGPLFITALSAPVLGEHVGARRWAAVGVGFVGVLVALRPGGSLIADGAAAALGAALCYASSALMMRALRASETLAAQMLYPTLFNGAVSGLLLPGTSAFVVPQGADWVLLAAVGLLAGGAQLCLLAAFRRTPAATIAPAQYSQMVWGVLAGWLLFGTLPDGWTAAGAALIVSAGLFLRDRPGRRAAPAPEPAPKAI